MEQIKQVSVPQLLERLHLMNDMGINFVDISSDDSGSAIILSFSKDYMEQEHAAFLEGLLDVTKDDKKITKIKSKFDDTITGQII